MVANHAQHKCKECQEELPSFMELLKHVAKQHFKEQSDTNDNKSEDDMFVEIEESYIHKHGDKVSEADNEKDGVFKESVLDK